jgi:hypothetical protein
MKRTAQGLTHGDAPAGAPFIAITLKEGWALSADGTQLSRGARRVAPELPVGASLVPAIPPLQPTGGRPTKAERGLARFLHLRLPAGASLDDALALARSWSFVERADRPPAISLP